MLRSRQEKEQLVRKFEEIVPILKNYNNFGWEIPDCMADPEYKIYPDVSEPSKVPFKSFTLNVQTGWHSEIIYRDAKGVHRIPEGVTPIKDEWSNYCSKAYCSCGQARPVTL